jgi:hypothetical protein
MCNLFGKITCMTCLGQKKLRWFIELSVNFQSHFDDFIKKSVKIPDDKLRDCLAKCIYKEEDQLVTKKT